jgi:hypothetical protein
MRDQIENTIHDRLFDLETPAPDLFNKIAAKRTPFYIFRNKILLNKFKLMGAAVLVLAVLWIWPKTNNTPKTIEQDGRNLSELLLDGNMADQGAETKTGEAVNTTSESSKAEIVETMDADINNKRLVPSGIRNQKGGAAAAIDGNDATTVKIEKDKIVSTENPKIAVDLEEANAPIIKGAEVAKVDEIEIGEMPDIVDIGSEQEPELVMEDKEVETPTIIEIDVDSLGLDVIPGPQSGDIDLKPLALKPWNVQLTYGASYAGRFLSGSSAYKVLRNEQEQVTYSDNIKLHVNYSLSKHFEVFTGITYSNRNESVNAAFEQSEMVWETKTRDVVIHDPVIGTYTKQVTYSELVEHKNNTIEQSDNRYQRLIVPIGLRWNGYTDKFTVSPSLSLGYQIWNRNTGKVLSADMESMSDLAIAPLRKPTGIVQVSSAVGLAYRLNHRWSLLAEPGMQYYLSPVSAPQYSLKQRDYSIDLNFGLKYNF